ncbi:MAG TPA: 30S ribosomal protein S2 [Patescibacteria group bacterium]|nr:30S ribosomal protein S2 [Patescibacteria group bacterium]
MPQIPTLLEMLHAGVHFGHRKSKWYPKMEPFIFDERNGVHILNLELTQKKLEEALRYVTELVSNKGVIVFVGTKKQAQNIIKQAAIDCGMPYVHERWLGGTITNFSVIHKLINNYKSLKKKKEMGDLSKYTKKEQLDFTREIERLEKIVGGISTLEKLPDAVFIADVKNEKTAITEARKKKIPVVALCDSNVNPELATYPIPANDDATRALTLLIQLIAEAVKEGKILAAEKEIRSDTEAEGKKSEQKRKRNRNRRENRFLPLKHQKQRRLRKRRVRVLKRPSQHHLKHHNIVYQTSHFLTLWIYKRSKTCAKKPAWELPIVKPRSRKAEVILMEPSLSCENAVR